MGEKISIRFFDEHGEYAGRYWSHVPRQGDEIMLSAGKRYEALADKSGKVAFKIGRVVWGVEGPTDHTQFVNIEVRLADGPAASQGGGSQ